MDEFNAQSLANTAWAFATAGQSDAPPFAALGMTAELRMGEFNAKDLANTAWAFATAGQAEASLLRSLARSIERRPGGLS